MSQPLLFIKMVLMHWQVLAKLDGIIHNAQCYWRPWLNPLGAAWRYAYMMSESCKAQSISMSSCCSWYMDTALIAGLMIRCLLASEL